jgi:transcriptional regulator with XRE-family HTH domain
MNIVLQRIIQELKEQNLKQKDLTDHLNISENCFGSWKRDANQSYLKYLHAIADFLGVSVEYLRGETDQKEKPPIGIDERLKELYDMTEGLNETDIIALKSFVAGLKANRQQD